MTKWPGIIGGAAVGLIISCLYFFPGSLSLHTVTGFVQLTAMRPLALVVMGGLLLIGTAVALVVRRASLTTTVVVLAVVTVLMAGQWFFKGLDTSRTLSSPQGESLTVVSANVLIGNSSYDGLFDRIRKTDADVVALQEAAHTTVTDLLDARSLTDDYFMTPPTPTAGPGDADSLLLVKKDLKPQLIDSGTLPFATVGVRTRVGEIYSVHAHAPIERAREQRNWARSVRTERRLCENAVLLAGDFNATTASPLMRGGRCKDAAETLNMGARGSWPAVLPSLLGARIDHHLYYPQALRPVQGELFNVEGSDHRGLEFTYAVQGG